MRECGTGRTIDHLLGVVRVTEAETEPRVGDGGGWKSRGGRVEVGGMRKLGGTKRPKMVA